MIRLGIVGCNYGRAVQLPAFRADSRCRVVALAGSDAARAAELAREAKIPDAYGDWAQMIERSDLDAVAIAVPPRLQPAVAVAALKSGKAVFVEKPMAADLEGAAAMMRELGPLPAAMDFNFTEVMAFRRAKTLLDGGAIGRLRNIAVAWHVENASTRLRLKNWKTTASDGGGALGNFVSHSLHYLEWFGGPLAGLSARLSGLPDDPAFETNAALSLAFASGAAGSLSMSCAAFAGLGHRLEFYGDDGALVLANPTTDYMRGFALHLARRPNAVLTPVALDDDPLDRQFPGDGRIAPVARLASRFIDAIEQKRPASPGFTEGYRVQELLEAVRRSHDRGAWLDAEPEALR